ncbi:MAG: hypothetical protein JSV49_06105 [Thermoplasmata archaeon]|nr:MAG: hypothetical protein JSV49_06105 [Thermoplasmata archaeon]
MSSTCVDCDSELDGDGNCPICDKVDSKETEIKHVEGAKVTDKMDRLDKKEIPRTRPVRPRSHLTDSTSDEMEDVPELTPEDIKIDFDKIDSSLLFEEDFEDETEKVSIKILPQTQKPSETKIRHREVREGPLDPIRSREVYSFRDRVRGTVADTVRVSYRTKGNVMSKKGQALVLVVAMTVILIIIIALKLFGFLDF